MSDPRPLTEPEATNAGNALNLAIAFVAANTFEFDSRTRRAATALSARGHRVIVVALPGADLAERETIAGVEVVRPEIDRRILSGLRPLPGRLRRAIGRLLGISPDAERLAGPDEPTEHGSSVGDPVRRTLRRALEILAYRRRVGAWVDAVYRAAPDARVVGAKALVALPVALGAARRTGGRVVYDVADLHTESGRLAVLPGPIRRIIRDREGALIRRVAALTAVTAPMAEEVARRYGVERPAAIHNVPPRWRPADPEPRSDLLATAAEAAGIPRGRPVVLYQGAFRERQGIETLLAALASEPLRAAQVAAVFLGFGELEPVLRAAAARAPGRFAVLPPVPSGELLEWTSGADLAFVGAPPVTRNQELTIPNKLFESLMAGVPVVVAAGTAIADLVAGERVGRVVDPWTPEAIAGAIAELLGASPAERTARRRHVRDVALERYAWEVEAPRLVEVYERAAAGPGTGPLGEAGPAR